jgi:hypothetical protein
LGRGRTPETNYYGIDQIGSVRRVFTSSSSAPAFNCEPYGVPLQTITPTTDFTYAGMFFNPDSRLGLTKYRVYDPSRGGGSRTYRLHLIERGMKASTINPVIVAFRFLYGVTLGRRNSLGRSPTGSSP